MTTLRNNEFIIEASFPQAYDFIRRGLAAEVIVGEYILEAGISQITPDGARNIVTFEVTYGRLAGGELARVIAFGHRSNHSVIPLSALRNDGQGYYILYVENVEQTFGSNYYVRIERVNPGVRDINYVAITGNFGATALTGNPIITNSDMLVQAGDRVRLVAGYDFEPTR